MAENTGYRGIQSSAGYISLHIQDLFREKDVPYNLRASKIVIQPVNHTWTKLSLTYQGAKVWNSLPEHIKSAETVGQFQSYINTHLL